MSILKDQLGGGGGSGTVTQLTATLPATITPDPTTTTGDIGVQIATDATLTGDGSPGSPLSVVAGGGSGTVTSITATLPVVATPDPITNIGDISLNLSVGAGLTGDGSPGNPLDIAGSPLAEHGPDKFRAIGDGATHIIDATINPDTGINWTQAEADAYWYGCKTKYQINDITITTAVNGFAYTINIGGTPYTYTAGGGDTTDDIAQELHDLIDAGNADGTPAQNATVDGNILRLVLTSTQTITISGSNMTNTSVMVFGQTTINVATDTVDWAAFQHALTLMEQGPLSYLTCGNGKQYVTKKSLEMPHWIASPYKIVIDGKCSNITSVSGTAVNVLSRICPSVNAAVWMGFTQIHIRDFSLNGNGIAGDTGLYIEAAHGALIENVSVSDIDIGFDSRFCLKIQFNMCDAGAADTGFRSWNAEYFGANLSNAGNNLCHWVNCEAFCLTGSSYGFHVRASDCCKADTCVVESRPPDYGFYWDNAGSSVAKNFHIDNCHLELVSACTRAVIGAKSSGGSNSNILITNTYNQGPGIFIELDSGPGLLAVVRDIPYVPSLPAYRNINGAWCRWHFENTNPVGFITGSTAIDFDFWTMNGTLDASYWATDFGGNVPSSDQVRNITFLG